MTLTLRPYQREALDALYAYWDRGGGNGLIVLPTGAGKSLVIASLCRELLADFPALRIGIVTHVKELIAQNAQELLRIWSSAPVGIYSAGLGRRDAHARILFCGIQSVHRKADWLGGFDLLLIDEAHLIGRSADSMYGRFIDDCRSRVPDLRLVGLTATPFRLDSGRLDGGDEAIFDDVVYEATVPDLIDAGFLSELTSKRTATEIDVRGVPIRAGEFSAADLELKAADIVEAAVAEIVERGRDRQGWLVFCSGVDHARKVRAEIQRHGVSCETVTGDMPAGERDQIISAYKARQIRALTSVGVLTTGFNAPHVDLLALLRSTLSTGLYVQMVGRGFRLAPGKTDCLILDYGGNVRRHGPIDAIVPRGGKAACGPGEKVRPDSVRAKLCPQCDSYVAIQAAVCDCCGFAWTYEDKPKHQAQAEDVAVLSRQAPEWLDVGRTTYHRHTKADAPDSLRVEYDLGVTVQREWLAIEHKGFARQKAGQLWRMAGGDNPVPETVAEALDRIHELRAVTGIRIRRGEKYHEVTGRRYGERPAPPPPAPAWENELEEVPF